MQSKSTKSGKTQLLFLVILLNFSLLCGCSTKMFSVVPQDELHKPTEINIYHGITRYSYTEADSGYGEIFDAIETTWLSDKSLRYRASSSYDSVALRGMTRIYFICEKPVEWIEGENIEKYKGYCFFIPMDRKVDGEFIGFTDDKLIGTDSETYSGLRYYEYSEDIGVIIENLIAVQDN